MLSPGGSTGLTCTKRTDERPQVAPNSTVAARLAPEWGRARPRVRSQPAARHLRGVRGRGARRGAAVPGRHHPHKWRHTYATELVRAGVDICVVQRLLGHASIASTVGYTHLVLDDLRGAIAGVWGEP
jgi:integrase